LPGDQGSPAAPAVRPALEAIGVEAGYGAIPIVSGVSLEVRRGEIVTLVGPNGAGKSTLLKAIVGFLRLTAGEVWVGGHRVDALATRLVRIGVGYVPQSNDVFTPLSVRENLLLGGYMCGRRLLRSRMEHIYELFPGLRGLEGRAAGRLSGGERKMLALGRALMGAPSVLILDEPTAGLAPELSDRVLEEHVKGLARQDVAVLIVEQKARQAMAISDRTYVMVAGRMALSGSPADLLERADFGDLMLGQVVR
jgi:ABC-type branched-subunit amino acid transport system ATPase component